MADKTINQLTEDTNPTSDDYLAGWDTGTGAAKKITLANLQAFLRTNYAFWELLGQTTLGSAGDSISITPITARKNLMVIANCINSGSINAQLRFNNDSAANYARRTSDNGAADSTGVSQTSAPVDAGSGTFGLQTVCFITNISAQEKMIVGFTVNQGTAGAANAPNRREYASKWVNTASQITRVDIINLSTGDFAIGSQLTVLGHD